MQALIDLEYFKSSDQRKTTDQNIIKHVQSHNNFCQPELAKKPKEDPSLKKDMNHQSNLQLLTKPLTANLADSASQKHLYLQTFGKKADSGFLKSQEAYFKKIRESQKEPEVR